MFDYTYYNKMDIDISFNDCLKELKNLRKVKGCGYSYGNRWNECVLYYQWKEFYKKELELWDNPEFRRRLVENRVKYINKGFGQLTHRNILQGFKISGLYVGFSHHCPMWIKQFLEDFQIKSVYDPCGGWGHRMIGSQSLETDVTYIYNDINTVVYNNCCKMAKELNFSNVKFYNNDAGKFVPEEDYEAVFICPPYWNKEIYSNIGAENLSYEQFLQWWDTVVKNSLKPSVKLFAFVISNDLLSDMVSVCLDNGLKMLSIQALNNRSNYNHFERKSFSKKSEKLMIFEKFLN